MVQKFACALIAGDFIIAHSLLDPELSARTSPTSLQAQLREMVDYGEGPPDYALPVTEFTDWPDRRNTDIGWAYSSIVGPGYSEAVTGVDDQTAYLAWFLIALCGKRFSPRSTNP